jgi:hypothetical protein
MSLPPHSSQRHFLFPCGQMPLGTSHAAPGTVFKLVLLRCVRADVAAAALFAPPLPPPVRADATQLPLPCGQMPLHTFLPRTLCGSFLGPAVLKEISF